MWWNHLTKPPVWQAVWPIALGFMPIGAAFGIFAQQTGFTAWEVLGFSMIIFAGSAQFIGIAMMIAGSSIFSIVLTTFIVNLRHVLFSSTLASYMSSSSKKFLALFAFGITDETFAVNLGRFAQKTWSPSQALCLNMICYVAWALSTVAGCYIGEVIKIDTALVGYALTAMFIGLWSFYLGKINMIIVGFLAGGLALVFSQMVGYKLHIVLAAILAATIGCLFENWATRRARP